MSSAAKSPANLVVVHAGVSDPSSTQMLADRIAQKSLEALRAAGREAAVSVVNLGDYAVDIAKTLVGGFATPELQKVIAQVARADALIAATPVYKAGVSGLFKSFIDTLDNDLIIAMPVVLAATAGSARHALVAEDGMRPLFGFLRALTTPTSVFAAPDEWSSPELTKRVARAAGELTALVLAGVRERITNGSWESYQHQFAGNAVRAEHTADDVSFDTDLMRLAAGGALKPPR